MALRDYSEEIGKRYGWLTVREVFSNGYEAVYRCDSDCGTKGFEITRNLLLKTKTPSCGCYRSPLNKAKRHVEKYGPRLIGKTIGSLTVHELHPTEEGAVAVCSCSFCGSDRCNVPLFRIVTEHCTTCGCYRRKDMRTAVALQKAKALVGTASGYLRVDSVRATDTGRIEAVCTCHSCGLTDVVVPAKAITEKKVTDCGCRSTDERRRRKLAQARKRNRLKRMAEITEVQSEQQKVKPESVTAKIPTGIAIEIPAGHAGFIMTRSSTALKGVHISQTLIDSDYRGELFITATKYCGDSDHFNVNVGDRVAQLYIIPLPELELEWADELSETERGTGGYGSTGR